jgi:REP-associated tyrosine transposase
MPRQARVVAAGVPHPITRRGNNRQEVFLLDQDRRRFYLDGLLLQARHHGVRLPGYCLRSNHVDLIAVPERPAGRAPVPIHVPQRRAEGIAVSGRSVM